MTMIWILVANDSEARLLETPEPKEKIQLLKKFAHPQGRKKEGEINADAPGRSFDSFGKQRHSMGQPLRPHLREEIVFARELIQQLEEGFNQNHFSQLVLIAPPHLLGTLREILPEHLRKAIVSEIPKDYPAWFSDKEVIEMIASLNL
jgi:protein required for attachment to host cells